MDTKKKKRLEEKGWAVGNVADFLGLSPEEERFIELRLALSRCVREKRKSSNITQAALAKRIGSHQSRIAKIEAGDRSVSLDQMVRALFCLGLSLHEIALVIDQSTEKNTAAQAI